MKTIATKIVLFHWIKTILIYALIFIASGLLLTSCAATSRDWKPAKVKMAKVAYNGCQMTRGYIGY